MATRNYNGETVAPQARAAEDWLPASVRGGRQRFLLMVHPESWEWSETAGEWLPALMRLVLDPGVGGVGHGPDAKSIDDSAARLDHMRKGRIILENGDARLAEVLDGGIYLQRWKAQGSAPGKQGWAYGVAWESPRRVRKGDIRWSFDEAKEIEVRRHLARLLGDLSPELVERDVERARARWERYSQRRTAGTIATEREEQARTRYERMRAALAKLQPVAPKVIAPAAPESEVEDDEPVVTSTEARTAKPTRTRKPRVAHLSPDGVAP